MKLGIFVILALLVSGCGGSRRQAELERRVADLETRVQGLVCAGEGMLRSMEKRGSNDTRIQLEIVLDLAETRGIGADEIARMLPPEEARVIEEIARSRSGK